VLVAVVPSKLLISQTVDRKLQSDLRDTKKAELTRRRFGAEKLILDLITAQRAIKISSTVLAEQSCEFLTSVEQLPKDVGKGGCEGGSGTGRRGEIEPEVQ
jgi:hypothetical protein